jgi:hypothetical protein
MLGHRQEKLVVKGQIHRLGDEVGHCREGRGLCERGDVFFIPGVLILICQQQGERLGDIRFQPDGGLF